MHFRAVFFDLDDTLCDAQPAFAQAVSVAFASLHLWHPQLSREVLQEQWEMLHQTLLAQLTSGELSMAEVRTERFRRLLTTLNVPDNDLADSTDLLLGETQLGLLKLFPDVRVLEAVRRRGLHVGIITNGAGDSHPDSQRSKIEYLHLQERVDTVWISDDMGYRKPDPRAFLPALEAAGCEPGEAIYIGDSISNDIVGANCAGMTSVLLWRSNKPLPDFTTPETKPDYVFRSLAEVGALIS